MSLELTRSEAARVSGHVDLRDIRMFSLETELVTVPGPEHFNFVFRFNQDLNVQHSEEDAVLLVSCDYELRIRTRMTADDDGNVVVEGADAAPAEAELVDVANVSFQLNALFEVDRDLAGEPFTESELAAFGETTGKFALYPYARELVADMTGRMGLPSLHMPVLHLELTNRDE